MFVAFHGGKISIFLAVTALLTIFVVMNIGQIIADIADFVCGYPLFILLIGGGLFLFLYSGMVSLRRLPSAVAELRMSNRNEASGSISSFQALMSVVAATVGMGNIAGVAIALVMGGPGAIFWLWVSAVLGMATKYHEGVVALKYKGASADGAPQGGTMHVIEQSTGRRRHPLALMFAFAGLFGTLCIINANQLTEALINAVNPASLGDFPTRLGVGIAIALTVTAVVVGGIRRIAGVASVLVPFMVAVYFAMVFYIIGANIERVPATFALIFESAFSLKAGWGALVGVAIIGARRAALVNEAGVGTAGIMHGTSRNDEPVREGLIAMLGPALDSGLVCTMTALALLLAGDFSSAAGVQGLTVAMSAFGAAIPYGEYLLTAVVTCFALSSMFSYSFYGNRCAAYLWGERSARWHTWFFIATLVLFAVIPLSAAVSLCDLFFALMVIPTMFTLLRLSPVVKAETRRYFSRSEAKPSTVEI